MKKTNITVYGPEPLYQFLVRALAAAGAETDMVGDVIYIGNPYDLEGVEPLAEDERYVLHVCDICGRVEQPDD